MKAITSEKRRIAIAPFEVRGWRYQAGIEGLPGLLQNDQILRRAKGQILKQHGIDHREYCRIRSDSERDDRDHRHAESPLPRQVRRICWRSVIGTERIPHSALHGALVRAGARRRANRQRESRLIGVSSPIVGFSARSQLLSGQKQISPLKWEPAALPMMR